VAVLGADRDNTARSSAHRLTDQCSRRTDQDIAERCFIGKGPAALVLGEVRKTKSEAKRKLSTPVEHLLVRDTKLHLAALRTAEADLRSSGFVEDLVTEEGDSFSVIVKLRDAEAPSAGVTPAS